MLAQIQLRENCKKNLDKDEDSDDEKGPSVGLKMLSLLLEKVGKQENKSKTCRNLHAL